MRHEGDLRASAGRAGAGWIRPLPLCLILALLFGLLVSGPDPVLAFVVGKAPQPLSTHKIFGNARSTGATLMLPGPVGAEIRSVLLPSAAASLSGLPPDAVLEKAYIFWSGSLAQNGVSGPKSADPTVSFTLANGAAYTVTAAAGDCTTVIHPTLGTTFPPFYYCRAEVTALVAPNKLGGTYNGTYTVGGVAADPGHINASGGCVEAPYPRCQAKYAAWSMVLIYSSPSETLQRDINLYDGFLVIDHEDGPQGSLGVTSFVIGNFLADQSPQGTLSYFAVETDVQLGTPPQDTYPPGSQWYCTTCQDYVKLNGTTLTDEHGWPGNIFNESAGVGSGVDIDVIEVGSLLAPGSTSAVIEIGSGTGPILSTIPPHGGGELLGYGWTLLTLRRPAPNFKTTATSKAVNPTQAGQGETLAFTLNLLNAGSLPATSTVITDTLPPQAIYKAGSLQLGGAPCTDAADGDPCTVSGQTLTINLGTLTHLPPGNSRQVSFLATVAPSAASGQLVCNQFSVVSAETPTPYSPPAACFTVKAPELLTPQKTVVDLNGGSISPDDVLQFTVTIPAKNGGPVSGISFTDDMPPNLQLLSVIAPPGAVDSSSPSGGAAGKGQVKLSDISIPPGLSSVSVTILAQIDSEAEFAAAGIPAGEIEGRSICNQGSVSAAFLPAPLLTDDPDVAGAANPTCVTLVYSPKLGSSAKSVLDLNGGKLEPGDTLRYTLSFVNSGNRVATLNVTDSLPPQVNGFLLLGSVPGASFNPPPAGASGTGQLVITGLTVLPGSTRTVQFEVKVAADATNGALLQNCAAFEVGEKPSEGKTICAPGLTVYATPDLSSTLKTVQDLNGAPVRPGDTLRFSIAITNSGNRAATSLAVTDVVSSLLTAVQPLDGGTWNAATRTLSWSLASLAPGATATVRFEAQVVLPMPSGTQLCNQASVASAELPVEPSDDPATAAVNDPSCVTVVSQPDFSQTTKVVQDLNGAPTRPGDPLRYSIVVRNDGTETGTGIVVQDVVSPLLTAVVPLDGGTWNAATRTLSWTIASLAPGEQKTLRFEAAVVTPLPNGTTIDNQAWVSSPQVPPPGVPSDDPATPAPDDPTRVTITAQAALSVEKTVQDLNGGAAQPGDQLVYTLRLRNSGDAPARATTVSDPVSPSLVNVVPLDGGVWNPVTRLLSWPAADVVPGVDRVLRFQASLLFPLAGGTVVCNQGSAASADLPAPVPSDDPATPAPADPTCLTVESKPDLSASKKTVEDLDGGKVEPGDLLRYSIVVENIGTQDAAPVSVTDVVSTDLTSVVPLDGGSWDAATRTLTWSLPKVAAKGSATVRFLAQVVLPLADGTKIVNQASIASPGLATVLSDDPATPAAHDPTVVTVSSAPVFTTSTKAMTDLNGGKIEPGDTLSYSLALVNSGTAVAHQVVVTDTLDANLELVSAGEGGVYDAATRTVTWNSAGTPALAVMEVNAAAVTLTLQLKVKSPLPNGTQVCNQALVGSKELALPEKTDNPATPTAGDPTCGTVSSAPDLANTSKVVVDLNGAPVRPGDTLSYTITIPNTGNAPATAVSVTDVIDPNLVNVQPGQGGVWNPVTRTILWSAPATPELASLQPGATATLTFTAQVQKPLDDGTSIANQASVLSLDLPAPVLSDDPATPAADDPTVVKVTAAASLAAPKTVEDLNGGEVEPGDNLLWTITLKNTGDALAKAVTVTDLVDQNLTQVVPLDNGTYDPGSRLITWTVPQVGLSPGGDVILRFTALVVFPLAGGTKIANQGSVIFAGGSLKTDDPGTPAPADPTVVTVVSHPNLEGTEKTVSGAAAGKLVAPGTTLTYSIKVPNTGSADALDVLITDQIDTDLEAVQPLDGGSYDAASRLISWTVPKIAAGSEATVRFVAKVRADAKNGDEVSNQASVATPGRRGKVLSDDPSTPEPDDPTRLTVQAIPDLQSFFKSVKDLSGGDPAPGDSLEYTLTIKNSGTAWAHNIKVTDPVPPQLENIVPGQGGLLSGAVITWSGSTTPALAKLAPGDQVTLTFSARIRSPLANGTLISNQATASAEGTAAEPSDDPATPQPNDPTVLKVVSAPTLTGSVKLVKDLNGGLLHPGELLEYELRIRNSGSADATGARLIDPVPSYTSYAKGSTSLNGVPVPDANGGAPAAAGLLLSSPGAAAGVLRVGEQNQAVVRFRVQVRPETQEGTIISNQGLLSCNEAPLAVTDNPATPAVVGDPTQIVVGAGPNLSATQKRYDPKPVGDDGDGRFDPGEIISYEVVIPNSGSSRATNVVFTDGLDPSGRGEYVKGSLHLHGQPLSDASDGDAGTAVGNQLKVVVGSIDPGQSALIAYQVRIKAGPRIINQGTVRSTELQPELTDSDGNHGNGDSPTVVVVDGSTDRKVRLEKTVLDVNGGSVQPGDELLYTITVSNDGGLHERLDVGDEIPAGATLLPDSLVLPPGRRAVIDPPPAGAFQRGRVQVPGLSVGPGESVTLLLRMRLDGDLEPGTSVCNVASAAGGAGLDLRSPAESGCVLVGSPAGTGGLSGTVFRDLGEDNRKLDAKDQRLAGFQVQAYFAGNPSSTPAASAVSDEKGGFRLVSIPPGLYTVRVLSSKGAQMGTAGAFRVDAGRLAAHDLPVDPSGVLYEAVSGAPVAGAQIFLHYDETDPVSPGALVPAGLLGPGQQGQVSDGTGFYRFDLQRGRRYQIRVQPLTPSLQFPSVLIPPGEGFAVTGPEHEVVPEDQPDPRREGARLTYYLRFKVDSAADEVFNNHIPLDPLSSLIRLEKRADRRRASLGDLVTYTITVENRSRRDFLESGQQVGIEDLLPRGLRLLEGSGRVVRRLRAGSACRGAEQPVKDLDGSAACLAQVAASRATPQVLRFGPLPLGAGESLRLLYQVAVGLDTRQGLYRNRAVLRDGSFATELSNTAEALVEVEPDPDLDQGLLLGKVFCDRDGDRRQSRGEHGLAGVRVYLDNGSYAVTDDAGKYHLRNINPGLRLLKLDVNTLPVGSRMTTEVSRVVQFTRGLPVKVNFGARCQENWVTLQEVKRRPQAKVSRPAGPRLEVPGLSLAGDARALRLSVDGRVVQAPDLDLRLLASGRAGAGVLALRTGADGRLAPPLVLDLRSQGPGLRGWTLSIWRLLPAGRRELVRRFSGSGRPPAQLLWDGSLAGEPRLGGAGLFEAQLEAVGLAGEGGSSPRRRFTVDLKEAPPPTEAGEPQAFVDGASIELDPRGRFARVVGRTSARPPVVELRRGDAKSIFVSVGGAALPLEDDSLERVQVRGNLRTPALNVDGRPADSFLLDVGLQAGNKEGLLPAPAADGVLREAAELRPGYRMALVQRWTLRLSDLAGKRQRVLGGIGQPPDPIRWDGRDDKGQGMVQPGALYVARLTLEDGRGNLGQSTRLLLRAPAAAGLAALKLQAARLFDLKTGGLLAAPRQRLQASLRLIGRRPVEERYRIAVRVAPPLAWQAERWAGQLKAVRAALVKALGGAGLAPARYELSVDAVPLPSALQPGAAGGGARPPPRQESLTLDAIPAEQPLPPAEPPRVLVDGEKLPVKTDGSFEGWVKVNLGSALVIDLRDASGRRAVLLQPTRPRARIPAPGGRGGVAPGRPMLDLGMRGGPGREPGQSGPARSSAPASAPAAPGAAPFGAEELQRAFGSPPRPATGPRAPPLQVPASQLRVDLPPRGAVLKSHELAIRGQSHPENKVVINGTAVALRPDGSFTHLVKLPDGKSELLIQTEDRQGNRGTLRWPLEVSDRALFLMAMAEGAIGQVGAELDEETDHTHIERGPVMLHGRAVVYLKGRIKGRYLFKQYFVTAHLDTAKQREFEAFFDQVIDPNRFYPVYGDSSLEVRDANARDKYYVLVEADRSSLLVGNFSAGVKGIELLRYDRMLYGVKVDFDYTFFKGKLRQQAKAFVSRDDARLARDHNLLRATGGSIYYLRHDQVLVGSERVQLVVRERDTGLLLLTLPKTRDVDYVIDYAGGRLLFKAPVSSVADASFGISNPAFTLSTMAGHPVYIEVDYEYERTSEQGSGSWGVQVKDTLFDVLTLGASYVEESRSAEAGSSYRLYGGELTLRHGAASSLTAEVARSQSYDVQNFISEDGGLTYQAMNHVALLSADRRASDSNAYKVTATADLSDFFKRLRPDAVKLNGYFSRHDRGFFSDGTILEQGRTKYGGAVEWGITAEQRLTLRHDGAVALLPQIPLPGQPLDPLALREVENELSRLRYELRRGRLGLQGELAHQYLRDPLAAGLDSNRDTLAVMGSYRLTRWLRLSLGQDALLYHSGNDPQLGSGALGLGVAGTGDWRDRLLTSVGAALGITKNLEIEVAESVRWSGDNSTSAGLKLRISERASVYVRQQLGSIDEKFTTTSIVGAEDRFGKGGAGRTYGEYQLESGVLGLQNRAILGLSHTFAPWRGLAFAGGYEHQQIFGGHLPDGTPTGNSQRDVFNVGFEVTRFRRLKLSTQAELRYDNGSGVLGLSPTATSTTVLSPGVDTRPGFGEGYYADRLITPGSQLMLGPAERWQVMTRGAASWAVSRDVTLLGRASFLRTYNRNDQRIEADALELGFGAALRPVEWDWLNVLFKYSHVLEMRPLSLTDKLARRRTYDVLSLMPVVELPWQLQLVEKIAYKRVEEELDLLPASTLHQVIHTLLWINRINFHLTGRIDAGVEYRFLRLFLDGQGDQLRHGALVELGYWIHQYVRLGAGYNFSSFSDNELADQDRDASGFFFRVVGRY